MGYGYDLEAAQKKIPESIEAVDEVINVTSPKVKELLDETAKFVNAGNLTKAVNVMDEAIDSTVASFKGLLGEENDSATTGSLHGALAAVKKLETALNG